MDPKNYKLFLLSQYFPKDLGKIIIKLCPNPASDEAWFLLFMESNDHCLDMICEEQTCCIEKYESGFSVILSYKLSQFVSSYAELSKLLSESTCPITRQNGRLYNRALPFCSQLQKNIRIFKNTWKYEDWDFLKSLK